MPRSTASRRTQFSSCDACHRSRVACDASKMGHQPGQERPGGSCSRCLSKSQSCTFTWIKKSLSASPKDSVSGLVQTTPQSFGSCETTARKTVKRTPNRRANAANEYCSQNSRAPSSDIPMLALPQGLNRSIGPDAGGVEDLLGQWSEHIFHHAFGTLFGHLVGRNGCPLVDDQTDEVSITPIKLFGELDHHMDKQSLGSESVVSAEREEWNRQIDLSLRHSIQAFAARWLPVVVKDSSMSVHHEEFIRSSWRTSRRDMLKVTNRVSYRSVFTLYIFGQTPVPLGVSEEEEMDGISSLVCSQTALLQLQQLRGKMCQLNSLRVSSSGAGKPPRTSVNLDQKFLNLDTRAYWAAVVWDTSNALILNIRSSLTSGLKGACLEPVWRVVRAFLVGSFHAKSEDWRKRSVEISDHMASQIVAAAAICTTYTWRTIASVKEALREGVEEDDLLFSWNAVLDAFDIFKATVQPLLSSCERRLHFLGQAERLSWYQVVLHYHLGILILFDTMEAASRSDLLSQIPHKRPEAEQESFNVLKFGLESKYVIFGPLGSVGQRISVSFVAIDPNPKYIAASVQLMTKAFSRRYQEGSVTDEVHSSLLSTLREVSDQLARASRF